ncbi:MAG: LytTR family DNA-binding domain-containing protein [bacterium]
MKAKLICSDFIEKTVESLLEKKGFILTNDAGFVFIEKGQDFPEVDALFIVFEKENLTQLITFLEKINLEGNRLRGLTAKKSDSYHLIFYEDIAYFEADGNYVYCLNTDGVRFEVKEKLYQLEKNLDREVFIRVSRSYIVNILNVAKVSPFFKGKMLLKFDNLDKEIMVTKGYSNDFKSFLGI